ncbi:MAG TPA: hypothetical protein VGM56_08365 [Byssovorax sp.]|jgi:hypothetical protein
MALHDKQKRYLERFFPGLIAAVATLGDGEYLDDRPQMFPAGDGLRGIQLSLRYLLKDGNGVSITISLRLPNDAAPYVPPVDANDLNPVNLKPWNRLHYAMNYGTGVVRGKCRFRVDLDESGHHVHLEPDTSEHIPWTEVMPDTRNLDPIKFVEFVATYRATKSCPIARSKP